MTRVALYLRQSKNDDEGIVRQRDRGRSLSAARGWQVIDEFVDDDVTASKPRGPKTAWGAMLARSDDFDVVVSVDLDRIVRSTRDLNVLIDHGLMLATVDGEIDLTTADGEFRASMLATIARFEVRRKGERQTRANIQRARRGVPPKGIRLTGYTINGEVIEDEARMVRLIFDRFAAGESLWGIASWLQAEGFTTRRGGRWSPSSVSGLLHNRRYAGRSIYRGEDVGDAAWPALVDETQFAVVQSRLADPARVHNHGDRARKHLGSGLYWCECGLHVRASSTSGDGGSRYTCRHRCFYRTGTPIDELVVKTVRARLALSDLASLLVDTRNEARLSELRVQRERLTHRIATVEADYDTGLIDGRRYRVASEKARDELATVSAEEAKIIGAAGPLSVFTAADPVAAFDASSLAIRRRVIDALMRVTIHPQPRGHKGFNPDSVSIDWRQASNDS